jgi:hypothetical protein
MVFRTPPKLNGDKSHAADSFWFATSPSRRSVKCNGGTAHRNNPLIFVDKFMKKHI